MATLEQIEQALRAADAAGNAEDARKLAQAYADMRGSQQPASFGNVTSAVDSTESGPSAMDTVKRQAGLGARAMMQGGADLVGIVADPFIVGANKLGANQATMRQGAGMIADRIGLPQPQNAAERVSGDVTAALTGGGGVMGVGRQLARRAPGVMQAVGETMASRPGTQVTSLVGGSGAGGATREAGGGQGAQVTAALVGGLSPSAVNYSGAAGLRGLMRGGESGRNAMQQGIDDFRAVGANPSVGQATGNRRAQGLESLLTGGPTSGGVMVRAAERQADDIGRGLQARADQFFPNASAERAGRAIEKGSQAFAGNVKATRRALYWQADQLIPDTTTLPLTRTQQALQALTTPTVGAESTTAAMINPKIAELAKNVGEDLLAARSGGSGGLPYTAVKDVRSRIGEALSDFSLTTDKPTAEYKRLYAALSQDMEDAARQQGPAAQRAVKRANNYFKTSQDRIEQVERVIDRNGGPEKVYNAVMAGTRDGGTTLRAVMQSLPSEGQRAVTGAAIKRMGLATPGNQDVAGEAFSAQTFLTNWNKVSPEAKRALFDRHGPAFVKQMDRIASVAERIRDGSKVFANPSGTANKGLAYTYAGSLAGSLLTGQVGAFAALVGGGAGSNVLARAMTNPKFVGWLAKATELPVSALPQQAVTLKIIADRENDPDLAELAQALKQQRGN